MATPANSYRVASAGLIGVREDLSDVISDITPMDFPLVSAAGRGRCTNVLTEWQMHSLAAFANAGGNAQVEGEDATNTAPNLTIRLNTRTQIMTKVSQVTDVAEAVRRAGRSDEMALEVYYRMREIRRDQEAQCSQNG